MKMMGKMSSWKELKNYFKSIQTDFLNTIWQVTIISGSLNQQVYQEEEASPATTTLSKSKIT